MRPDPRTLVEPQALDHLEDLAAKVPGDRAIVELGVYRGQSLSRLAAGAARGNQPTVVGVDPWGLEGAYPGRPQMRRRYGHGNMAHAGRAIERWRNPPNRVRLIRDFSTRVGARWQGPHLGLLFIDAQHTEDAVLLDHAAWSRWLLPDSFICFDDFCPRFPGVVAAVERLYGDRYEVVGTRLAVCRGR